MERGLDMFHMVYSSPARAIDRSFLDLHRISGKKAPQDVDVASQSFSISH